MTHQNKLSQSRSVPKAPVPRRTRRLDPPRIRPVPAVTKAAGILRLLGRSPIPRGVNSISQELKIVPSTCLHILRALVSEELVSFDPHTKRYTLDAGILSIARLLLNGNDVIRMITPELDRISDSFGVTVILTKILNINHSITLSVHHSKHPMRFNVEIGSRFPTLISATGRCYAAFNNPPAKDIESRFAKLRWSRSPNFKTWLKQVSEARIKGYAVDEENYIQGATVIAAPIFDHEGSMTHAVTAVSVAHEMRSSSFQKKLAQELQAAIEKSRGRNI